MNCKDLKILLSACANNELSTSELETVNAHLADCSDCKATLSTFQAVRQQISSLQDLSVKFDIKDAVMADIKKLSVRSPLKGWLRPSLVAIPIVAIIVTLLVLQPWVAAPGFQEVMAKSYLAVVALKSYRTEVTYNYPPTANLPVTKNEVTYVAPDRYYTKQTEGTNIDEVIKIGEKVYYETTREGTVPQIINPDASGLAPDMGNTFRILNSLHGLQTLKDETIDGVKCYHYRGNLELGMDKTEVIDIWVGKDDNLPRKENFNSEYTTLFLDLNKPMTINAPLTAAGELQPGWHLLQSGPHLTVNYSDSVGGTDMINPVFSFDINLYNYGFEEAKNVHVTFQTMTTDDTTKPAELEAIPSTDIRPVNIASWQSMNFKIQWQFDGSNLSKLDLVQALQKTTFTVSYHKADGTEIDDIWPKTDSVIPVQK